MIIFTEPDGLFLYKSNMEITDAVWSSITMGRMLKMGVMEPLVSLEAYKEFMLKQFFIPANDI
jgi:hypothetical protein